MNQRKLKRYVAELRAQFQKASPSIYEIGLAHLTDLEFLQWVQHNAEIVAQHQGEHIPVRIIFPDGEVAELGPVFVQSPEELN
jgi:hypothetical protein